MQLHINFTHLEMSPIKVTQIPMEEMEIDVIPNPFIAIDEFSAQLADARRLIYELNLVLR